MEEEQEDETRRVLCYKERGRQVRAGHDTAIRLELRFSSRRCREREKEKKREEMGPLNDAISGIYPSPLLRRVDKENLAPGPVDRLEKGHPTRRTYVC